MTTEEFRELLAAAKNLSDAGEQIVRVLAAHTREVKDPQQHATLVRMLNTVRDTSASINSALRDAPRK
jgi:hypothetical protein